MHSRQTLKRAQHKRPSFRTKRPLSVRSRRQNLRSIKFYQGLSSEDLVIIRECEDEVFTAGSSEFLIIRNYSGIVRVDLDVCILIHTAKKNTEDFLPLSDIVMC